MLKSINKKKLLLILMLLLISAAFISCSKKVKVSDQDYPSRNHQWKMNVDTIYPACVPDDKNAVILTSKSGIKFVRTPDSQFNNLPGYPFKTNYVEIDGLQMNYVDEGPKDGEVVMMLHGQPAWSYLYRKMIPVFAKAGYRAIAIDLIGTGRSDKPVELSVHTFEQHVKWVKIYIHKMKLKNVTLFCQDWGGLIGLRIAGDDPKLFARIVTANTRLPVIKIGENPFYVPNPVKVDCGIPHNFKIAMINASLSEFPESFQLWINYCLRAPDMEPGQVLQTMSVVKLSKSEEAAYNAPYPGMIYKAAPRAFPSMIAGIEENNKHAWESLGKFNKPFLSFAGEKDALLGTKKRQDELINHIPGSKGQPHERFNANHFIQEDVGIIMAEKVVAFMKKNSIK